MKVPFILLFFCCLTISKADDVERIAFNIYYDGYRDNVPITYFGMETQISEKPLRLRQSWDIIVHDDNSLVIEYLYGPAHMMHVIGRVSPGVVDFDAVLDDVMEMWDVPENHEHDYLYQVSKGRRGDNRIYVNDPAYWNHLIDKIEGHIVLDKIVDQPRKEFFVREFQNVRLPRPDPQITSDPPPSAKSPLKGNEEVPEQSEKNKRSAIGEPSDQSESNVVPPVTSAKVSDPVSADSVAEVPRKQHWVYLVLIFLVSLTATCLFVKSRK
jgi:hypothetical protein